MTCTIRSLVTVASILVANGVCAFVNVNGITSSVVSNGRHLCVPAKSTAPVSHRSSRRWGKSEKEMMKDGSRGVGGVDKKVGGSLGQVANTRVLRSCDSFEDVPLA